MFFLILGQQYCSGIQITEQLLSVRKSKIQSMDGCFHCQQEKGRYGTKCMGGYFDCGISRQLDKGKGLYKIDFAQNKCILSCTQIFLCKYKQGPAKNQKTLK
jgi:hypothetical protein